MKTARPVFFVRLTLLIGLILTPAVQPSLPATAAEAAPGVPRQLVSAPAAPPPTVCGGPLAPIGDTHVEQANPDANDYDGALLTASGVVSSELRVLLNFDVLASIPDSATIYGAQLVLTVGDTAGDPPFAFDVRAAKEAWDHDTVTWNTQPAFGPVQAAISGTWDNTDVVVVDLTPLVTQWVKGGLDDNGLVLLPASDNTVQFYSTENISDPTYDPRLEVDCALASPPVPEDQTAGDAAQAEGLARLYQNSTVTPTVELERGALRFAMFRVPIPQNRRADPLDSAWWFLETYSDLLRLPDPHTALQFSGYSDEKDDLVFRRVHNGLPVYPAQLAVHLEGDFVAGLNGRYIASLTLDPEPRLSAAEAETLALARSSPGAALAGDTQLRYVNLGLLGFPDWETHLAWQVNVADPLGARSMFIDADTGAYLDSRVYFYDAYDLILETANNFGPDPVACFFFTTSDDQWFDENGPAAGWPDPVPPTPDAEGLAAFASITAIDQFWRTTLGRDSYDNRGQRYHLFVHAGSGWQNAHYTPWCDFFEFGDGMSARDVMGHEVTHGVVEKSGGLIYENQSGALNESLADIFSHYVDLEDWFIGEDTPPGAARDIANPPNGGNPDHMLAGSSGDGQGLRVLPAGTAPDCGPTGNDCGFVHTNSGIHNKVGFLLFQGGLHNGRTITALGANKTARLFYGMLTNRRLSDSAQLIDARNAAIAEATALAATGAFGFTGSNVCQVRNAYASVGLGVGDADCDGVLDSSESDNDNDGVPNSTDNCLNTANGSQSNADGDGLGDACDPDADNDTVANGGDNCWLVSNVGQEDGNSNSLGDHCEDRDGDGVRDFRDNCVSTPNGDQRDRNSNGEGDACDSDRDGDGVPNGSDNSPDHYNPSQSDADGDGIGDLSDRCPGVSSPDNGDLDRDGRANPCDPDDDNDGVLDVDDNCPLVANASQIDPDGNGVGFACDTAEQQAFGDLGRRLQMQLQFPPDLPIVIPLPICPACGGPTLPLGYLQRVTIDSPQGISVRIADSSGVAVASSFDNSPLQVLHFQPLPYGGTPFFLAGHAPQAGPPLGDPAADGVRYRLELYPGEGLDLGQTYTVTITLNFQTLLPSILR